MTARLFLRIVGIETRKLIAYRADFWITTLVAFAVHFGVACLLWGTVFRETATAAPAGYGPDAIALYYLLVILMGRVVRGPEFGGGIATDIYEGAYTRYRLYPISYFAFKYAQHLGMLVPALLQLAMLGTATAAAFDLAAAAPITAGSAGRAAAAVVLGNLLNFLLLFALEGVAFWAENIWSLNVMFGITARILGGFAIPLALFPSGWTGALEILPFRYLYEFPVSTLLGRVDPAGWARGMAIGTAWILLSVATARAVWTRGSRAYTAVGI